MLNGDTPSFIISIIASVFPAHQTEKVGEAYDRIIHRNFR